METSLSREMLHYFSRLSDAEQRSIVEMTRTFSGRQDEKAAVTGLEEYNQELEQNDAEIEAGEFVSHQEVLNHYLRRP